MAAAAVAAAVALAAAAVAVAAMVVAATAAAALGRSQLLGSGVAHGEDGALEADVRSCEGPNSRMLCPTD